jgi:hypothetical protein
MMYRWRRRAYDRLRREHSMRRFLPDAPAESMREMLVVLKNAQVVVVLKKKKPLDYNSGKF